jgi:hypothetical protein
VPNLDQLPSLPLFAQALVASRLVRRAVLAVLTEASAHETQQDPPLRNTFLGACDAVDRVAYRGQGIEAERAVFDRARQQPLAADARMLAPALEHAVNAAEGAVAAYDFPVDHAVHASLQRCIAALADDPRVNPVQLAVLIAADADLLGFACQEAGVGTYDGLGDHVKGRLTPVHPLTLTEPARTPEEAAR